MGLPTFLIIGAMKCGTSALHTNLGSHPDVAVSHPKELNFFCGPERPGSEPSDAVGNWHRGLDWYARHFDDRRPARGEASPGYTSPSYPEAVDRIAAVLPHVRLIYLVRDPVERAVSQYRHHVADGDEQRPPEQALLDPRSQYVSRSRYFERLLPYLQRFPMDRITVVVAEALAEQSRQELARLFEILGVDPSFWSDQLLRRVNTATVARPRMDPLLRERLWSAVADDVERLRAHTGLALDHWST